MPWEAPPDWYLPGLIRHHRVRSARWRSRRRQALLPNEPLLSLTLGLFAILLSGWALWHTCHALQAGPTPPWTYWVLVGADPDPLVLKRTIWIATPTWLSSATSISGLILALIGFSLTRSMEGRPLWTSLGIATALLSLGLGLFREMTYHLLYAIGF